MDTDKPSTASEASFQAAVLAIGECGLTPVQFALLALRCVDEAACRRDLGSGVHLKIAKLVEKLVCVSEADHSDIVANEVEAEVEAIRLLRK